MVTPANRWLVSKIELQDWEEKNQFHLHPNNTVDSRRPVNTIIAQCYHHPALSLSQRMNWFCLNKIKRIWSIFWLCVCLLCFHTEQKDGRLKASVLHFVTYTYTDFTWLHLPGIKVCLAAHFSTFFIGLTFNATPDQSTSVIMADGCWCTMPQLSGLRWDINLIHVFFIILVSHCFLLNSPLNIKSGLVKEQDAMFCITSCPYLFNWWAAHWNAQTPSLS